MRKLIILAIFLTLGVWSQAQVQKVARYVGGVEIGRKYVSGNLVWEKQQSCQDSSFVYITYCDLSYEVVTRCPNDTIHLDSKTPNGYIFDYWQCPLWVDFEDYISDIYDPNAILTFPSLQIGEEIEAICHEDTIVWDYEGVMTVGDSGSGEIGWVDSVFGSITPISNILTRISWYDDGLGYIDFTILSNLSYDFLDSIYVNGIVYLKNDFINTDGSYITFSIPNPFPAVGQTCDIKLKYTLANQTVTIGGEEYETVTIGTQTWLKRNLHYDDSGGGIYSYNDDTAISDEYGYLYTWDAAMRVDTLIDGWHLPSEQEVNELKTFLYDDNENEGGKIKEIGFTHWDSPNEGATNESGFTAIGSGFRNRVDFNYYGLNQLTYFWLIDLSIKAFSVQFNYQYLFIDTDFSSSSFSVRLIKDAP